MKDFNTLKWKCADISFPLLLFCDKSCNTLLNSFVNSRRKWLRGQSTTRRTLVC